MVLLLLGKFGKRSEGVDLSTVSSPNIREEGHRLVMGVRGNLGHFLWGSPHALGRGVPMQTLSCVRSLGRKGT